MAASPSSVLTQGLGAWGTPSLLVTLGFGTGVAPTTAALTGTVAPTASEAQIVAGGRTIILTLANDTWVASGATFNAQRQNLINGLTASTSQTLGWNNVVKALQAVGGVVRTSDTAVTITLDAQATYNIAQDETVTATIPASALVTSLVAVIAAPTFKVYFIAPPSTQEDQASNWQADYWKRRSKKDKKRDDDDERIRLGILPPEERASADEAVAVAINAAGALDAGRVSQGEAMLAKMDAREQYEQAYREAYREAYVQSVVAEHWKEDLRIATRRRKAILLLLH